MTLMLLVQVSYCRLFQKEMHHDITVLFCCFVLTDGQERQFEVVSLTSERHIGWDKAHVQDITYSYDESFKFNVKLFFLKDKSG